MYNKNVRSLFSNNYAVDTMLNSTKIEKKEDNININNLIKDYSLKNFYLKEINNTK